MELHCDTCLTISGTGKSSLEIEIDEFDTTAKEATIHLLKLYIQLLSLFTIILVVHVDHSANQKGEKCVGCEEQCSRQANCKEYNTHLKRIVTWMQYSADNRPCSG